MADEKEKPTVIVKEIVGEGIEEEEEEEEEKWLMHYSSFHQILLVGEGDFSFSFCLAKAFGSATNIVASSLDSYDALIKNYKEAKSNLENLKKLGASVLHGVDATKMKLHSDLRMRKFDRIIFNFPHAGFYGKEDGFHLVMMHRTLVHGFLMNARSMLRPNGEIHINHKTSAPFCHWNIPELASKNSLTLRDCVKFRIEDFPGYNNKRGSGSRCDEPFPLRECSTFKLVVSPAALKMSKDKNQNSAKERCQIVQMPTPTHMQMQPAAASFACQPPLVPPVSHHYLPEHTGLTCQPPLIPPVSHRYLPEHTGPTLHNNMKNECLRIFSEYLNHNIATFGKIDSNVPRAVHEAIQLGFARYIAENPGSSSSGYINILEELCHLSKMRILLLQYMLHFPQQP